MLSDEDKKRIEAEEAYRLQVRKRLSQQEQQDDQAQADAKVNNPPPENEEVLYRESPAMSAEPLKLYGSLFLSSSIIAASIVFFPYWWIAVPVVLAVEGIGLFIWWIDTRSTRLTITTSKTTLERGWLSKSRTEVFHDDVRTVEIQQSFVNRFTGHGTFQISSAGESDSEISIIDMPRVQEARELVQRFRKR